MSRRALWLLLLLIPGCVMDELRKPDEHADFVPGVPQPENCGTPETPKPCNPTRKRDGSTPRLRPVVLVQELGAAPSVSVATTTVLPGEPQPTAELSSEAPSDR
jgi:hypothetical protein